MLLLQIFLIALNAIFACAEVAVISMNDIKLERMAEAGDKRAKRLVNLTSQPAKFLATIQVAITLSGFIGSAFAAENFSDILVNALVSLGIKIPVETLDIIAVVVITLILSYFTLVFGELVPKRVAQNKAEGIALGLSSLISVITKLFAPIVWILTVSTNIVLRLIGIDPNQNNDEVSEEEIRMMVDVGTENGSIDTTEKELITNVLDFDNIRLTDIVTHRVDIDFLWVEDSLETWHSTIVDTRHTIYPVCEESTDNIIGILNAKDYFRLDSRTKESVMEIVKKPYFVPNSVKANDLFHNMRKEKIRFSVIVDGHGGVDGIITLYDLIEQIVGDIFC